MQGQPLTLRRLFPTPFLLLLLGLSVLTNVVLVVRLTYPRLWQEFRAGLEPAPSVKPTDHVRGHLGAQVTVIEYGDFRCPFCAEFHRSMKVLTTETRTRWVYRHLPLRPPSFRMAEAAECAGEQGRFWDYADALFETQGDATSALSDQQLSGLVGALGLDVATFERCLDSEKHRATVAAHRDDAVSRQISGTPTFYVNGQRFEGAPPHDELRELISRAGG